MDSIFKHKKIVPVCVIDTVEEGCRLAEALLEAGLDVMEITLRTESAMKVIASVQKTFPQMSVGAGSILSLEKLTEVIDTGCAFGISPGLLPELVELAQRKQFAYIPGVATPSEVMQAATLGLQYLKFFPAQTNGGIKALKAINAPFKQYSLKWIPTGGITPEHLSAYYAAPEVYAVGGSWMVSPQLIKEKNYARVTALTQEALKLA